MPLTDFQKEVLAILAANRSEESHFAGGIVLVNPTELDKIKARALDPITLKQTWISMSDEAEAKMVKVAVESPKLPIGVAFVDEHGKPGWIGDNPKLRTHAPSVRGCLPVVHGIQ
jgi:hypothetical protein